MKHPTIKRSIRTLDGKALSITLPNFLWVANDHIAEFHEITPSEMTRRVLRNRQPHETPTSAAWRVLTALHVGLHRDKDAPAPHPSRIAELDKAYGISKETKSGGLYGRPCPIPTFVALTKEPIHGGEPFIQMVHTNGKLMVYQFSEAEALATLKNLEQAIGQMMRRTALRNEEAEK
jgi:predicted DNA-binding ribbon-helix-helix protein